MVPYCIGNLKRDPNMGRLRDTCCRHSQAKAGGVALDLQTKNPESTARNYFLKHYCDSCGQAPSPSSVRSVGWEEERGRQEAQQAIEPTLNFWGSCSPFKV